MAQLDEQRKQFNADSLLYMSQVLWDTRRRLKESAHSSMPIELAIIKLAQSDGLRPLADLVTRLQALEASLGAAPAARAAPPTTSTPSRPSASPKGQKKKARKEPAPVDEAAGSGPSHEEMLAARSKLEEHARNNDVVREALRILEGTVVNLEK
jgi:DNA polymerase III gamma/tau subunit